MKVYITNKIISLLVVLLCIAAAYFWFGNTVEHWQVILITLIIFNYGHFFLGFYYQLKSFLRKPNPWQYYITFVFMSLVSIGLVLVMFKLLGFIPSMLIGLAYFLLHGLLNEQTLILRQTGIKVPLLFITALTVFIISIFAYSIPDKTFFFNRYLEFWQLNDFLVTMIFNDYYLNLIYFKQIFIVGSAVSAAILFFAWLKFGFGKLTTFLACVFVVLTGLIIVFGPPTYLYMYFLVVGYHSVTWLLFFLVEKKKQSENAYRNFVIQNVLFTIPLIGLAYLFFQPNPPSIVYWVFDYNLFVILTYVHISTSFMNDAWLQKIQALVFNRFSK